MTEKDIVIAPDAASANRSAGIPVCEVSPASIPSAVSGTAESLTAPQAATASTADIAEASTLESDDAPAFQTLDADPPLALTGTTVTSAIRYYYVNGLRVAEQRDGV